METGLPASVPGKDSAASMSPILQSALIPVTLIQVI